MTENTFVIRIWCEHSEKRSVQPQFRGVIEHVISGKRQYIADMKVLNQFIQTHLSKEKHNSINKPQPIAQWIDEENR